MKKILLHNIQYSIGGPNSVLDNITHSYLADKYHFVYVNQKGGCGFNPFKAIAFVIKYARQINREKADCIYISGLQYVGFLMTLAAKLSNVKRIILSVHGSDWDTPDRTLRKRMLMYVIEPLEVRLADRVFTVCKAAQHSVKALKAAKKGSNYGVIYNTMPTISTDNLDANHLRDLLGISPDKIIVMSVGRVVDRKGHAFIIDAIKKIHDKDYVFVIVGEGDYLSHYQAECHEEIQNNQLYLLGKRNDVLSLLRGADIFLSATLNENHSVALLEAVSMKCAALVTNVGGNTEIITHEKTGIVIPPKKSDAIIDGLNRLKIRRTRELFAEAAYAFARQKFSVNNTLGKLEQLFDE